MTLRISIHEDKCCGAGSCVLPAPDLFDQHEDDGIVVLLAPATTGTASPPKRPTPAPPRLSFSPTSRTLDPHALGDGAGIPPMRTGQHRSTGVRRPSPQPAGGTQKLRATWVTPLLISTGIEVSCCRTC